jgi:hypothetical protein
MLAVATHEEGAAILAAPQQLQQGGQDMSFNSYARPRILLAGLAGGAALVAGVAVWLALAEGNAGAAGTQATSTSTTSTTAAPAAAASG